MLKILFLCVIFIAPLYSSFEEEWADVPTLYNGRFRPAEVASRLIIYDLFQKEPLKQLSPFRFLWEVHFAGTSIAEGTPLFSISQASSKQQLKLPLHKSLFSYHEIKAHLQSTESRSPEIESIAVRIKKFEQLNQNNFFLVLPSRYKAGYWLPLAELDSKEIDNFTLYSDELFAEIKNLYAKLKLAILNKNSSQIDFLASKLAQNLKKGYLPLAGTIYQSAHGKKLSYPTLAKLKMEKIYYAYPWVIFCIVLYFLGLISLIFFYSLKTSILKKIALLLLGMGFILQTTLLMSRSYILGRPPVSNMFETMIYVPWIAMGAGIMIQAIFRNTLVLAAACFTAISLLILLQTTQLNAGMENVQAVLDSQYWLIVHVLMVVGSYGLFFLSGVLGHLYLIVFSWKGIETPFLKNVGNAILQSMYVGIALLIPGTILGGVWAAQSWGRFWDWDPKESWAFISACIYMIWIHAFKFGYIKNFGLATGSIIGLLSITFTWYGVNYILGSGLHTYGFGNGGEGYYYLFLGTESILLLAASGKKFRGLKKI